MKTCKTCQKDKPLDEFPLQNVKLEIYRANCKICYAAIRKNHRENNPAVIEKQREQNLNNYYKNKETCIKRITEYNKNNKDKVKVWQTKSRLKTQKEWAAWKNTLECSKCGEDDGACLDFHHVNQEDKKYVIAKIKFFKKKLIEELEKCIVLCANCHRKHHKKDYDLTPSI